MEVRPGYKQTDIGVFPTEWDIAPLGMHATFRTGPFGSALHQSDYTIDGIPVVNPMHIVDGSIVPTRTMTISEQAAKGLSDFRISPGEIVIGRRGDMGRCAVVQGHNAGWLCGTGSMIIRPLHVDAGFLQRVLSSPQAVSAIENSSVGTTMVNLNQATLADLKVQFPPHPEQRAIAAALSDVDALLRGMDRLIAKKRDLKQAAMQQLLTGRTRLPGFHGEWEVKRLGEIGTTYGGLTGKSKADFGTGKARYVTFMNVMANTVIDHNTFDAVCVSPSENQNRVQRGDLLFNGSSETPDEVALCSLVTQDVDNLYLNSFCFGFRPRKDPEAASEADGLFLTYYIRSTEGREIMKSLAQGSTRYNLSKRALLAAEVRLPSLPEQSAIAAVLSDMDAELSALEARRAKTRVLKQAMMQELLTGRTRLV
jgi:type I restriction enzyme S subunit